jgi:hypothetical protein
MEDGVGCLRHTSIMPDLYVFSGVAGKGIYSIVGYFSFCGESQVALIGKVKWTGPVLFQNGGRRFGVSGFEKRFVISRLSGVLDVSL